MIAAPPVFGSAHDTFMERCVALDFGIGAFGTVIVGAGSSPIFSNVVLIVLLPVGYATKYLVFA